MAGFKDSGKRRDRKSHYRHAALRHPLRRLILLLMLDGMEAGRDEIAAELDRPPGRVAYHLRVLVRRDALKATARGRPAPALYRFSPQAQWARKMLDEYGSEDPG